MSVGRRDFIALAGAACTAAVSPLVALAEQSPLPVIGWLGGATEGGFLVQLAAYRRALAEAGFVEGKTVQIEWRWEAGDIDKAMPLLEELIARRVSVMTLTGNWQGGQSGAAAPIYQTLYLSGIPAVTNFGRDPRIGGLVGNLNRPERNLTGDNLQTQELEPKRLSLLHDMLPAAKTIGYVARPINSVTPSLIADAQKTADALGLRLMVFNANTLAELDTVFSKLRSEPVEALMLSADAFFNANRDHVTGLVVGAGIPAIAEFKEFAEGGALLAYGTNLDTTFHQIGAYTAAILHGAKVADLPVVQNETYDFAINLRAAKTLGVTVPLSMLQFATQVIE